MSINKVQTIREFVIKRICRLYPTYWACVSFTFLLICIGSIYNHNSINIIQYVGNLTMVQFYLLIPDIDGPYWTMIVEMTFYIFIVLLFYFKFTKYLKLIGLTLSILPVIISSFFFNNNKFAFCFIYYIPLLQFMPLFFAGMIFYKIYNEENKKIENYFILGICLTCQILMYNYSGRSRNYISHNEYAIMLSIYFLLFIFFINNKLKFIISPLSLFFGKISFALYLVHQYVSKDLVLPILVDKLKINFWIASLFIIFPIVIGLATLITFYVEVPLTKKMKEKLLAI